MAKFITINMRYFLYSGLVLAIVFFAFLGFNFLGNSEANTASQQVEPELKIVSLEFEPPIVIRDLSYGGEVLKGIQTLPKTNYKIAAIIQNMTEKTMSDIPVVLTIVSLADQTQKISKEGKIPILEPGATARIAFENIQALGDAQGKSATAGQHEMVLAIKSNPEGGVTQNTEAKLIYNIDSTVK
ncbi:MAG TPA: hypothetical protein GXX46_10595 [Peptococcaceae bacterium]|nr:hypothetical protein [Peptococcaceae bacterium]